METGATLAKASASTFEEMNEEARKILSQKTEDIKAYSSTINEAERILTELSAEIERKTKELSTYVIDEEDEFAFDGAAEDQIHSLYEQQAQEIANLKLKHETEMNTLRNDFKLTVQEAERWSQQHLEVLAQEKTQELESLRREAEITKRKIDEATFLTTKTKSSKANESIQKQNAAAISMLESQISELTSITREEMRDSRAKIDECLAAIELRRQMHASELARLDEEIELRRKSYEQHLSAVKTQLDLERSSIEQAIDTANLKAESTERIIKHLEDHHEIQLSEILNDIDTMRRTLGTSSYRSGHNQEELKQIIRDTQFAEDELRLVNEEIRLIEMEIKDLESENRNLEDEVSRVSSYKDRRMW